MCCRGLYSTTFGLDIEITSQLIPHTTKAPDTNPTRRVEQHYLKNMPGCAPVHCSNSSEKGFLMKRFPRDPDRKK
nr:unnamed protein product [Callosobruchus analis]